MIQPPASIISFAEDVARRSPCAKSKRGAVVFQGQNPRNGANPTIYGHGFNGQPDPFRCTGTDRCRRLCGQLCEHAEGRAIRSASGCVFVTSGRAESGEPDVDLVHVKIGEDGKLVAGGSPKCWQCSRAILDCGFIAGVWLYQRVPEENCPHIVESKRTDCMLCQGEACNLCSPPGSRTRCVHDVMERHHGLAMPDAVWHRYTADEFHRTTLRNCGMEVA